MIKNNIKAGTYGVAAIAAGLVGQLPGENGRRVGVARDNGLDVLLVLSLDVGVCIPVGVGRTAESLHVGGHASIISPVVDEVDDQLDSPRLSGLYNVVQTLETIGTGVDDRILTSDE